MFFFKFVLPILGFGVFFAFPYEFKNKIASFYTKMSAGVFIGIRESVVQFQGKLTFYLTVLNLDP